MFFYLIHNLPWGNELEPGKRNVRIFIIGTVCYILLHALLYTNKVNFSPIFSTIIYTIKRYFWWIVLVDAIAMSIIYKLYYGRNILTELPLFQIIRGWVTGENNDTPPNLPNNVPKKTQKPISPKNTLPTPPLAQPQSTENNNKYGHLDDISELDIDILSENGSLPDQNDIPKEKATQQVQQEEYVDYHSRIEPPQAFEKIDIEDEIDDADTIGDIDNIGQLEDQSNESVTGSGDTPLSNIQSETKLTAENIFKYVGKRKTIENNTHQSIHSDDLRI